MYLKGVVAVRSGARELFKAASHASRPRGKSTPKPDHRCSQPLPTKWQVGSNHNLTKIRVNLLGRVGFQVSPAIPFSDHRRGGFGLAREHDFRLDSHDEEHIIARSQPWKTSEMTWRDASTSPPA